jgi:hypothetical protein
MAIQNTIKRFYELYHGHRDEVTQYYLDPPIIDVETLEGLGGLLE